MKYSWPGSTLRPSECLLSQSSGKIYDRSSVVLSKCIINLCLSIYSDIRDDFVVGQVRPASQFPGSPAPTTEETGKTTTGGVELGIHAPRPHSCGWKTGCECFTHRNCD